MVIVPFVFFTALLLVTWLKRGFDVYAYILALFAIISFFSIIMDEMDLYSDFNNPKLGFGYIAPFFFCVCLYFCIRPYRYFKSNYIRYVKGVNEKIYKSIVFVYFSVFLLIIAVSTTQINEIVKAQNLATIRTEFYHGDAENVWSSFSGYTRYLVAVIAMLSGSAKIMILFFFINIVCLKKKMWFNIITLLSSMTPLILSLYTLDRSSFVHWFLLLGLMAVLFRKQLKRENRKNFYVIGVPVVLMVVVYLFRVTVSRFGDEGGSGALDGLVYYAGQSYYHFCLFFNQLGADSPFSLVELFPFTYQKIFHMPSYFEQCEIVSKACGFDAATFSTFLGLIMSISGKIVMILFVILYGAITTHIVRRPVIFEISFKKLVHFFIVGIVVVNGLFGYCYMEYVSIFNIIIWLLIGKVCSYRVLHAV